ncbi:Protein of unknown function [Nonomuraea solani]|uniref:DinB superfamily protein n=1 Tax=Nonomuraea solani TaxID=1144553 RepID=A0A1H6CRN4_9ACTN|nr:DinB family protein [Nonomuraea solani]SEG75670.1 Protein of unknown function [Nonomuraea solani]
MTFPRVRPPFVADEPTQLIGWLDMQRAIIQWKCEGLSDEDAYRPVLPTSPLMTVAGLVSHLRWTEHCWFEIIFKGRDFSENPQFDESVEDAEMRIQGIPLAKLLDDYERQCRISNEIVAAHSLDDVGKHPDIGSAEASLRWMVIHMVEETARHAGQLDTIRELLDGQKGYY